MRVNYKRLFNDININTIICIAYKSHYAALNIPKTASHKEIKDAYYRLSMIYHPDKNKGSKEAAKKFRDITAAYEVLGNVRQRRIYDSGSNPIQKTSQYNPKQPFETSDVYKNNTRSRDYRFDDWSKAQYTSIFKEHHDSREHLARKRMNEAYASRQHTYSLLTVMIFVSLFIINSMYEYTKIVSREREKIKKSEE